MSASFWKQGGSLAIWKPVGLRSARAVGTIQGIIRRSLNEKAPKIGHGGTLDELAEGVLVLGIGKGTKTLGEVLSGGKTYRATLALGIDSPSHDLGTDVIQTEDPSSQNLLNALEGIQESSVLDQFTGRFDQIPPLYSALKKDGKRFSDRAREGETDVIPEARTVHIPSLRVLAVHSSGVGPHGGPGLELEVDVGSGPAVYIRSLVRDLGQAVGTTAVMTGLIRTRVGTWTEEMAVRKPNWTAEHLAQALVRS